MCTWPIFYPPSRFGRLVFPLIFKSFCGYKENQILEKWVKESSLICVYPHLGVRWAKQVQKLLIIFFFIVLWPLSCGIGYPKRLAFCGSYWVLVTIVMKNSFAFGKGKKAKILWNSAVAALFWVMWQERNLRIFEGKNTVTLRIVG